MSKVTQSFSTDAIKSLLIRRYSARSPGISREKFFSCSDFSTMILARSPRGMPPIWRNSRARARATTIIASRIFCRGSDIIQFARTIAECVTRTNGWPVCDNPRAQLHASCAPFSVCKCTCHICIPQIPPENRPPIGRSPFKNRPDILNA